MQPLKNKRVLVMGLGRFGGGIGVTRFLASQGAIVTVNDSANAEDLTDSLAALADIAPQLTFKLGGHHESDFLAQDLIVVNPAVDRSLSPPLQAAIHHHIPLTTEINLFLERCPATAIGITGSVGKSTTTALIHQALQAALSGQLPVATGQTEPPSSDHRPLTTDHCPTVFLGGNIGRSLLLDLPSIRPKDLVVLELSSFMLEETPQISWSPHIAVVTNIFPNHLDRHKTLANLTAAKQNILRFQKPSDLAILNADHDLINRWAHLAKGKVIKFTTKGPASHQIPLLVPGNHNQSNAQAALAVIDALLNEKIPLNRQAALQAMAHFTGLPHRLQLVHTTTLPPSPTPLTPSRTLRYFNDSKATTPEAAITAIQAFPPRTALFIVGGYDKNADLSNFEQLLASHAAAVIAIGATGQAIIQHIQQLLATTPTENPATTTTPPATPTPKLHYAQTLRAALPLAQQWATESPTIQSIVLSPACASWDQFPNYEARGNLFTSLAQS